MIDEIEEFGDPQYSGPDSPLIKEVTASGDGRIDIEIAPKSP